MMIYNLIKKMDTRRKDYNTFFRKKTEEKQISTTIMRSVHGKGTVFPVKLKLQGESLE